MSSGSQKGPSCCGGLRRSHPDVRLLQPKSHRRAPCRPIASEMLAKSFLIL